MITALEILATRLSAARVVMARGYRVAPPDLAARDSPDDDGDVVCVRDVDRAWEATQVVIVLAIIAGMTWAVVIAFTLSTHFGVLIAAVIAVYFTRQPRQ